MFLFVALKGSFSVGSNKVTMSLAVVVSSAKHLHSKTTKHVWMCTFRHVLSMFGCKAVR